MKRGPLPKTPRASALKPLVTLAGTVRLRPVRLFDASAWSRARREDQAYLEPWEPSDGRSWAARHQAGAWPGMWRQLRSQTAKGLVHPMVIEVDGAYSGQLTVGGVSRGALQSAWLGYWVAAKACGGGVATAAAALAADWCFTELGLHRLEATAQPENLASRAVLAKLGFREEGMIKGYLRVRGQWRDHMLFGLTAEEAGAGIAQRLIVEGRVRPAP